MSEIVRNKLRLTLLTSIKRTIKFITLSVFTSSTMNNSVSQSTNRSNEESQQSEGPKRFEDSFQSLSTCEISPLLWLSVYKSRSLESIFVDIRRKRKDNIRGYRVLVPTKTGIFLHRNEFEKLKQCLSAIRDGQRRRFEFKEHENRFITGNPQVDGCWMITLKTVERETFIALTTSEVREIVENPNNTLNPDY